VKSRAFTSTARLQLWQVVHVLLSPSRLIWYRPETGDGLWNSGK